MIPNGQKLIQIQHAPSDRNPYDIWKVLINFYASLSNHVNIVICSTLYRFLVNISRDVLHYSRVYIATVGLRCLVCAQYEIAPLLSANPTLAMKHSPSESRKAC